MPTQRLLWPDVAKGLSIIGVGVLHVSLLVPGAPDTFLSQANTYLDPLRMPLFFLVSGLFSAKVLNFSLPQLFRKRLWFFLVPYLVWVPIEVALTNEVRTMAGVAGPLMARDYIDLIWTGRNMAWFLWALILFNLVLWATKKLPPWAVVFVAASPIALIQLHHDVPIVAKAIMYLPVFLLGTYARVRLKRFAGKALTPAGILIALGGFLASIAVVVNWNVHVEQSLPIEVRVPILGVLDHTALQLLINLTQYLLMLPAGILLAVGLAQIDVVARGLQFLGQRTLPVYLGHPIGLTLLVAFPIELFDLNIGEESAGFGQSTHLWLVLALLAAAAGGAGMWAIGKFPGVRWLLYPPRLPEPTKHVFSAAGKDEENPSSKESVASAGRNRSSKG